MFSYNARALFALVTVLLSAACAKKASTPFDIDVKQAVIKLQTGEVIARIEKSREQESNTWGAPPSDTTTGGDRMLTWAASDSTSEWPAFIEPLISSLQLQRGSRDPSSECSLKKGSEDSQDPDGDLIRSLGVCLRQVISPALLAIQAMNYWKAYQLPVGLQPLSQFNDRDLQLFLMTQFKKPEIIVGKDPATEPLLALQRKQFTDADLDELLALVKRRDHALMLAEKKISTWFTSANFKNAVRLAVKSFDRYQVLEQLVTESEEVGRIDRTGLSAYKNLVPLLLGNKEIAQQLKSVGLLTAFGSMHERAGEILPLYNLHPYALLALIPRAGEENTPLHGKGQNPFFVIREFQGELGDFSGKLSEKNSVLESNFERYKKYRDQDQKQSLSLENQKPFSEDAVKIAFIDTGIDYLQYPELAPFLSKGSMDYADFDESPYLSGISLLDHGTATTASLLTVLSQKAPELLKNRGIELAMWKLSSIRSLLSGVLDHDLWRWNPRHTIGFFDLLLDQKKRLQVPTFIPKIVSFSASFQSRDFLVNSGQQNLLKNIPWLWVMAAGNENINIDQAKTACFQDIPEAYRGQDRVLCVGALVKRQGMPKIASYSNYGNAVTVYAYESYEKLCPSGTSCATPAVSAAATLIASKFPALTAVEIKQVIVDAAEEKTLDVELDAREITRLMKSGQAIPSRVVKVFDPIEKMEEALRLAAAKTQAKGQSKNDFK